MDQVTKRHCTLDMESEVKTERKGKTMLPLEGIEGSGAAEKVCGSERTREGCNHGFQ